MIIIRDLEKKDREILKQILFETSNFSEEEKKVGLELIDITINNPEQKDYMIRVAELDSKVCGYYCIGQRSLTDGVYDLYWIVVDSKNKGNGIGTKLIADAESFVRNKNGRLILAETSSRNDYIQTRNFYKKNNYNEVATIKDFYKVGDDLIIFGKYLNK